MITMTKGGAGDDVDDGRRGWDDDNEGRVGDDDNDGRRGESFCFLFIFII